MNCLMLSRHTGKLLKQLFLKTENNVEICGMLGGRLEESGVALATAVYPLTNLSILNMNFAVNPKEFIQRQQAIEHRRLVTLALYHSHPVGSAKPSFRDLELPGITGLPSLIIARNSESMQWYCYQDVDDRIIPISVMLL